MNKGAKILIAVVGGLAFILFVSSFAFSSEDSYEKSAKEAVVASASVAAAPQIAEHVKTPEPLKAVYMTQCVASMPSMRAKIVKLIEETELNALVIDVKDYTGTVSFATGNPQIDSLVGPGCKVSDMRAFVEELHQKGIYAIGRVTVFQDPLYAKAHPELAVKKKSDSSAWKDRKGISFIDPGAKPFWDHIISIATSSYATGFDEINFDYIRFPSDGDMKDIYFSLSVPRTKREVLKEFYSYLDQKLHPLGIVTSADLFGMTTTNTDDLNIGQVLEYALLNFDYVAPMVYPSHYPPNFNGWPDPNKVPYEIVKFSMQSAVSRVNFLYQEVSTTTAVLAGGTISTTTPDAAAMKRVKPLQLRPWLQDNDYPVHYTPEMVRKQIQAAYDSGLTSWMLWDPANTYTESALLK